MSRSDHQAVSLADVHGAASTEPLLASSKDGPSSPPFGSYSPALNRDTEWNEKDRPPSPIAPQTTPQERGQRQVKWWRPAPLQVWFWIPLVAVQTLFAIGLEVALFFSEKNNGWLVSRDDAMASTQHYVYTVPPVTIAMMLGYIWTKTDLAIKRIQPYVDLAEGNSPAERSVLLDYATHGTFSVWIRAARNRHYVVSAAGLLSVLALTLQPLASALFVVREVFVAQPDMQVANLAKLGLNRDLKFQDLTTPLTAAGFSGASVQYTLPDPPFVFDGWTVAPFSIPSGLQGNGTVNAKTTAIKSEPNCVKSDSINMTPHPDGTGYANTASTAHCRSTWDVDRNASHQFEAFLPVCDDDSTTPPWFRRVVFWFFTYEPSVVASATFCSPTISAWNVSLTIDLASSNITSITGLQQINISSSSTGLPANGRAYNGLSFDPTSTTFTRFTLARQEATRLQLPAAVLQVAESSGVYNEDLFAVLTGRVYSTYLKVLAKAAYFLPGTESMNVELVTSEMRLSLSPPSVHFLAASLLVFAITSTVMHLKHFNVRRRLQIGHEPGTIASAVTIGGETEMSRLLDGKPSTVALEDSLRGRTFRYDSGRMKVFMDGEGLGEGTGHAVPR